MGSPSWVRFHSNISQFATVSSHWQPDMIGYVFSNQLNLQLGVRCRYGITFCHRYISWLTISFSVASNLLYIPKSWMIKLIAKMWCCHQNFNYYLTLCPWEFNLRRHESNVKRRKAVLIMLWCRNKSSEFLRKSGFNYVLM